MSDIKAWHEGYQAGYDDQYPECPYAVDTQEYLDWQEGYEEGSWNC